eukprot:gnl/TRDRNA2_/TRDRNA2_138136_c1_seq2.p1 gnl/TRDRNA2_/TRDRNA2_138136_c1~~gnl/TRDRNA2_/TRDRNA2_138136_c1_seq2.p1  ORF type:complete len:132 (-),score=8.42 gnl/TRDRNA2_/TRDRNA2_138136_c1_seq2:14-409(-)
MLSGSESGVHSGRGAGRTGARLGGDSGGRTVVAGEGARRGVSVSGAYVFRLRADPGRGQMRDLFIDAEDWHCANWLRFVNHSANESNLVASPLADGSPSVCIQLRRELRPGEELLLDYGASYFGDDDRVVE